MEILDDNDGYRADDTHVKYRHIHAYSAPLFAVLSLLPSAPSSFLRPCSIDRTTIFARPSARVASQLTPITSPRPRLGLR